MKRLSPALASGAVLALLVAACHRSAPMDGNTAATKLIAHTTAMLQILKDNQADPDKAMKELTAYKQQHDAEIAQLKEAMGNAMQKEGMKMAAASAVYGMRSAELDGLTKELEAKAKPH